MLVENNEVNDNINVNQMPEGENPPTGEDTPKEVDQEVNQSQEESQDLEMKKLEEKEQELKAMKDKLIRLQADFDNHRKRTQKEKEEWIQYASQGLIEKLLPALDNLERPFKGEETQSEEVQKVLEGFKLIYKQIMDILQQEGLEYIETEGQIFDPLWHEAMMQIPATEGQEDNQIVLELRKGYRFKDRLLRASMVQVAKKS